jgi:hypothetical protein
MTTATGLQSGQIRVAGQGAIWRAPLGTVLPTDSTTALDAAFVNLGYAKSGFVFTPSLKTSPVMGWQSTNILRLITTEKTTKLGFELLQSNADTLALAWDGTIVPGTGNAFSIDIPDDASVNEAAYVVDMVDGSVSYRFVIERAALLTPPTIKGDRTAETSYAFEVQVLVPADGSRSIKPYGVDAAVASA